MAYFHIITCAHIYKIIKNNKILFYQLFAINNHISNHTRSGHYTSVVKNRLDNVWYEFDDSNVLKKVEEEDLVNKNAYMLFYYNNI